MALIMHCSVSRLSSLFFFCLYSVQQRPNLHSPPCNPLLSTSTMALFSGQQAHLPKLPSGCFLNTRGPHRQTGQLKNCGRFGRRERERERERDRERKRKARMIVAPCHPSWSERGKGRPKMQSWVTWVEERKLTTHLTFS